MKKEGGVLKRRESKVDGARRVAVADLSPDERAALAVMIAADRIRQGEPERAAIEWALLNGAQFPEDSDQRKVVLDTLTGRNEPQRGRGRPRKAEGIRPPGWQGREIVERRIAPTYERWFDAFREDRAIAWLQYEALRLRARHPDADLWQRSLDLGDPGQRDEFRQRLSQLGARPCPSAAVRGGTTARELALDATAEQYRAAYQQLGGSLTRDVVARIVTRARKSK